MSDNNTITIPVGRQVLGRVINSRGESIDGREPITNATRLPLAAPVLASSQPLRMLETGIKVIDLLAPLPRGGVISMYGEAGVGKLVVLEELMHVIITHYHGYIVALGMDENAHELSELVDPIKELGMQNRVAMVFEKFTSSPELCLRVVQAGLTIAGEIRSRGHEVLMVVDENLTTQGNLQGLSALTLAAQEQGITTILLRPDGEHLRREERPRSHHLDGRIVLSRELARQQLWPAIDRLLSTSPLLESDIVSSEHADVVLHIRELLRRTQKLQGKQGLSSEDQQAIQRAAKIQQFFAQPFFVAEPFTEVPSEFVQVTHTVQAFKDLLEGRYDSVPEQAFHFTGTIDQVLARSKP